MRGETRVPDVAFEDTLRPASFDDFVGQKSVIRNLTVYVKAARERREPLDHALFTGMPGLGKTTLARIIAHEMKAKLHVTSGPVLKRPGDLAGMLTKLEPGDVLFIDEIHRILADVEEYLYTAMEQFFISIPVETGPNGRTINLPLKRFTLVGATTREGLLSKPFHDRFKIREKLEFYPVADLEKILGRSARLLNVGLEADANRMIAERSRGTPRIANNHLRRVRDVAQVRGAKAISTRLADEGLAMLGVDTLGLEEIDRKILKVVCGQAEPVGLKTIAAAVGEQEDTIEEMYEPYLLQQGLLVRTSRGRKASPKALAHLGTTAAPPERTLFT
ncbi:MAG TPA: Holliday junction branch migration DNA helicase RuvB [Planctomycetota bacterium]|nr:Holliday junction branch migration DNA helicase RuvB [Planctomycetota bacterium]